MNVAMKHPTANTPRLLTVEVTKDEAPPPTLPPSDVSDSSSRAGSSPRPTSQSLT